ncbi:MAG: hypothetical protein ABIK83_10510 [Candidatus Zixiibacteriota bacterium]
MSIREEEEKLFEQWQVNRQGFVRDGVVSESDYLNSNPKIAFILKEVNDTEGGGWDLRQFVSEGARRQTWDNIARWVHGIRNRDSVQEWEFYSEITNKFRIEQLRSICAINLKKSPGGHTADMDSLWAVAHEDKEFIQRQYGLYDPDLTICAGTGDLFRSVLGQSSGPWRMTERGIRWYERDTRKYVVSFAHPEARVQSSLLVYGLLDAIREIYP